MKLQGLSLWLFMFVRFTRAANALRSSSAFTNHNRHALQRTVLRNRSSSTASIRTFPSKQLQLQYDAQVKLYSTTEDQDMHSFEEPSTQHSTTSSIMEGLNPSQVEAVTQPMSASTCVMAGPGSGKTKVLTCRIAYLLEQDRRNRILAVTFTRKASGEMQKRVEKLLSQQQSVEDDLLMYPPGMNQNDGMVYPPGFHQQQEEHNQIVEETVGSSPKGLERVTLGTFHSVCAKILRYNGNLLATLPSVINDMTNPEVPINLDGSFVIADQSDQLRILKECFDEAEIDLKKSGIKPLVILNAIGSIKESLSQGIDPFKSNDRRKPIPKSMRLAKDVYGSYREKLFSNNAVDFDDLILLTREMLQENKELRQRLHQRWGHILVDEFQDTSRSQMDLIKLLTSSSLFVVGDADQSIYSWRGAHAGSMSDFAMEFKNYGDNGVVSVYLKENYRSTSNIVRAAEKVISMSGKSDESEEARRSMKPKRGSGPSPRVVACKDERAEANFVVDNISDMLISGDLQPAHSAAIIYRTNAQSRYLEEACVQKNLPYVIRGGGASFYKRAEVKDCLCFLRWLHNGNDNGAMLRAMKTPSRGIGDAAMREFREYYDEVDSFHREHYPHKPRLTPLDVLISMADGESNSPYILEAGAPEASVFISKRAMNRFLPFSAQMRAIRDKANSLSVEALLFYIIEELELVNHFDAISKSKSEFEERRENVQELRQAAKRYSKYGPALKTQTVNTEDGSASETALGNFLDDVALVADVTEGGDEGSGEARFVVNLMTIHGSKGMEFDAVFVVGNEEGTLPSGRALQEGEGSVALEEEKRLCYVAMTRAKTRLLMTWRKEVTNFSNWSDDGPKTAKMDRSRFLDALVSKKSPKSSSSGKINQIKDADSILQRRQIPSPAIRTAPSNQQARKPQSPSSRSFSSRPYLSKARNENTPRAKPTATRQADISTRTSLEPRPARPYLSQTRSENPPPTKRASSPVARPASPIQPTQIQAEGNDRTTNPRTPLTRSVANERPKPIPKNGARTKSPTTTSGSTAQTKESAQMDSTWFFPVGSDVVHEKFGKGKVLEPPEGGGSNALPVLVKFQDGTEQEFCARGSDIVPDFGL